jgi:hypothetical protein
VLVASRDDGVIQLRNHVRRLEAARATMVSMSVPDDLDTAATLSEAVAILQRMGFTEELAARNGVLHCHVCELDYEPSAAMVEHIVRFEGTSDPGDESIVFGLALPCGPRGVYSAAYGTYTPTEDLSVINALLPPRD